MADKQLILASASPRRQALIRLLNRPVHVQVADVDEESVTYPDPAGNVIRTARLKANAVAAQIHEDAVIIAADTTVAMGDDVLNKPATPAEARAMLQRLRGRTHQVHTGVVVLDTASGRDTSAVSTTQVTMRNYGDAEIDAYVASGDPLDKAGAYAIQNQSFGPVAEISGCYANVVGLPLCTLVNALREVGVDTDPAVAETCAATHNQLTPDLPVGSE